MILPCILVRVYFFHLFLCSSVEQPIVAEWFSTPASFLSGPGFNSRPGDRLSFEIFRIFLSPSWQIPGQCLILGNDRFLPHPFQFINHPVITRNVAADSVVKWTTNKQIHEAFIYFVQ
jgi:hypothetical protein